MRLAWRNLFQSKTRLVISIGGVALALLLILALDAIFAGVQRQVTAYIDHSRADLLVSQDGVRTLHMASSALPGSAIAQVGAVPGVQTVTPILYMTNMVVAGDTRSLVYLIGLPADAAMGGPWRIAEGKAIPAPGEAIIDRGIAEESGVGLGDPVKILGREFRVAGLSEDTASLINSVAFISADDFAQLRAGDSVVSYLLVQVKPEESPDVVAARIEDQVPKTTAQSRPAFAEQERRVIRDMSTDIIATMNLVGFFIGLAVLALTAYTATLARRAEYGVLKALGARNSYLYRVVLMQAVLSVLLGLAIGVTLTLLLKVIVPALGINLLLELSWKSLVQVGTMALVIAGLAALLPIRQIAGLDPAAVFRGGMK